jgi:hypothetical protein
VKKEQFRGKKKGKVVPVLKHHTINMYWGGMEINFQES